MEAITARVTMALSYTIHSNVEVKYEEYIVVCGIKYGISYLWHKLVKFIPFYCEDQILKTSRQIGD